MSGTSSSPNPRRFAREDPTQLDFTIDHLGTLRNAVASAAESASLQAERAADLVLAVNELATNSICHGGGRGTLRMWREGGTLLCEVHDRGHIPEGLFHHDAERPDPDAMSGRGLWLVDHLCDAVHVVSSPEAGSTVRVHMRLP
ncbi:MAG TPA: ATP-binding protein [Solirubrobacteraceae bacterium]|nr:ATP-binding protein [Solirubrobacteraceae bacterium]